MRAVIQRVSQAKVVVDDNTVGQIGKGFMILLGVHEQDTQADVDYLVGKISKLRYDDYCMFYEELAQQKKW